MARPTKYTEKLGLAICERIADGESLRAICSDDAMPARSTVFKWLSEQSAFSDQYARAREAQAEALFEDILDIADDNSRDTKVVGREGEEREICDTEFVQRAKLRVETRKWMASKLLPKKYGERVAVEHSGEMTIMSPEQRRAEIDRLLGKRDAAE